MPPLLTGSVVVEQTRGKDSMTFTNKQQKQYRLNNLSRVHAIEKKSRDKRKMGNKQRAVNYLGGECSVCGYNKCLEALEFHHKDKRNKNSSLAQILQDKHWKDIILELNKCVLVCANCHREIHAKNKESNKQNTSESLSRKIYLHPDPADYYLSHLCQVTCPELKE